MTYSKQRIEHIRDIALGGDPHENLKALAYYHAANVEYGSLEDEMIQQYMPALVDDVAFYWHANDKYKAIYIDTMITMVRCGFLKEVEHLMFTTRKYLTQREPLELLFRAHLEGWVGDKSAEPFERVDRLLATVFDSLWRVCFDRMVMHRKKMSIEWGIGYVGSYKEKAHIPVINIEKEHALSRYGDRPCMSAELFKSKGVEKVSEIIAIFLYSDRRSLNPHMDRGLNPKRVRSRFAQRDMLALA